MDARHIHLMHGEPKVNVPLAPGRYTLPDEAGIQVDHVWSRASMAAHEGVVYLTITDTSHPDTLTGISTPVVAMAELHRSFNDNGGGEDASGGSFADRAWQAGDACA